MSEVHVKILKEAKNRLLEEHYVCIAIKEAVIALGFVKQYYSEREHVQYKERHYPTYELLSMIMKSLDGYTVDEWLAIIHEISGTEEEYYQYRLAWIDNMIEYWRDK